MKEGREGGREEGREGERNRREETRNKRWVVKGKEG